MRWDDRRYVVAPHLMRTVVATGPYIDMRTRRWREDLLRCREHWPDGTYVPDTTPTHAQWRRLNNKEAAMAARSLTDRERDVLTRALMTYADTLDSAISSRDPEDLMAALAGEERSRVDSLTAALRTATRVTLLDPEDEA